MIYESVIYTDTCALSDRSKDLNNIHLQSYLDIP